MTVEIIGGIYSGSLAILTDAAHLMSDVCGFGLSLYSIWISMSKPTQKSSFGYHRSEVLGALGSIFIIWLMVAWLFYEATRRIFFITPEPIDAPIMLSVAFVSLFCNLFSLSILGHIPCLGGEEVEVGGIMSHGHDHDHHHGHGHSHGDDSDSSHDHDHDDEKHDKKTQEQSKFDNIASGNEAENINVRAAIVHIIGDML